MKLRILVLLLAALGCLVPAVPLARAESSAIQVSTGPPKSEIRAMWVVRDALTSPERIRKVVADASRANLNLLFVQVRGRGDAYYRSSSEPFPESLGDQSQGSGFDPLATAIEEAHRRGIQVHAWVNCFLVWSAPKRPEAEHHVLNRRPDWAAVTPRGTSMEMMSPRELGKSHTEGIFLDAGNPAVRDYLGGVIREILLTYDVDGIHLDYIRYPGADVGYSEVSRTEFMREYGFDPITLAREGALPGMSSRPEGMGSDAKDMAACWENWRRDQVTGLVRRVRSEIDSIGPDVALSAAVIADVQRAQVSLKQDWVSWMREGILDFAVPMCYSASTSTVLRQVTTAFRLAGRERIVPGIAVYNEPARLAVAKILKTRELGACGFSLFSYNAIENRGGYWRDLARAFPEPAALPEFLVEAPPRETTPAVPPPDDSN